MTINSQHKIEIISTWTRRATQHFSMWVHVMINWRMKTFVKFRHSLLLMISLLFMYPTESLFRDGNVILLNKCSWNTYDQTNIIQEMGVKSRIHCAVVCFQYGETCLGFEVFNLVSTIGCRLFNGRSRENCASPTTITSSLYYRRTDVQDTTTQPLLTTTVRGFIKRWFYFV